MVLCQLIRLVVATSASSTVVYLACVVVGPALGCGCMGRPQWGVHFLRQELSANLDSCCWWQGILQGSSWGSFRSLGCMHVPAWPCCTAPKSSMHGDAFADACMADLHTVLASNTCYSTELQASCPVSGLVGCTQH